MANGVALGGWRAHATLWAAMVALVAHATMALTVASILRRPRLARSPVIVEMDTVEKRPIPLEAPPLEPKIEPSTPAPRVANRSPSAKPPALLPPPNREVPPAPPGAEPPPVVFGVTPESVVEGESGVAVPVGNTLMTKDRTKAKAPPAPLPPAVDPDAFAPVADNLICEDAARVVEVKPDYPPEARRLQIEGQVKLRVAVDRQGNIRWARVIKSAGFGLDEAAKLGLARTKFKPARACDGRLVDEVVTLTYTFQLRD
ncbi:MAG TPA: energy transducer TonB [Polyangia bacterium]|nr:energy transducer TonB [Polyangia bacterium]